MPTDVIDLQTGKVTKNVIQMKTQKQQDKDIEYIKILKRKKELYDEIKYHCGGFFFYKYNDLTELLGGNTAAAFRFVYLCACADKEGYIIAFGKQPCQTRDDFTYIFDRPLTSTRKYVDELREYDLIIKDNKGFKINSNYFTYNIQDDDFKKNSARTFNTAIKDLYNNSSPKEHSIIGQLLRLVKYINIYNNILCWNIDKANTKYIQPLTAEEIRHILCPNSTYKYELLNKLEHIMVRGEPVLAKFESIGEMHYIINPRLFYRGNDPTDFKKIIDQFDSTKHQYLETQKLKKMVKGGI